MLAFEVIAADGGARRGRLSTPHGAVETPVFMPVGTAAAVKTLAPRELEELGAGILLANTYHLYLRPGHERVRRRGGRPAFRAGGGALPPDWGGSQANRRGQGKGGGGEGP